MKFLIFLSLWSMVSSFPQPKKHEKNYETIFTPTSEQSEMLKYKVIKKSEDYELREYPASTWICTQNEIDTKADPMRKWQKSFKSPMEAASSDVFQTSEHFLMLSRLFDYMMGMNSESIKIGMTAPFTTKRTPLDKEGMELQETCFWSGTPWLDKTLPKSVDSKIYIQKRDQIRVYVKQLGEVALSDEDWQAPYEQLKNSLKDAEKNEYFSVQYNFPWFTKESNNEIWIEQKKSEQDEVKEKDESYQSKVEVLPYEVIEDNEGYQLRKYPKSKWVCTKIADHDTSNEFLTNWRERFNSAIEAIEARRRQESYKPRRKMFTYLYQYISGVNDGYVEIDMASPVTKKHVEKEGTTLEDMEMCFWTGTPWQNKDLPTPIKKEVYLQEREEILVYVRKFGGWALSSQDWDREREALVRDLGGRAVKKDVFYTAGYNSPWDMTNRRNEVWLIKSE